MSLLNPRRHLARAIAAITPKPAPKPTPAKGTLYDGNMVKGEAGVAVLIMPEATPKAMRGVAQMLLDAADTKERAHGNG
jgi:hypothetical protein